MSNIEIISSCSVGMSSNASPMSRLELTPLDLRLLLLNPIQSGILFHNPQPQSQIVDDNFIHHLKTTLSRTLDFFPPLAGRLSTDDNTTCFFVDCNNAGVEFVHAVAGDVSVSDILEPKCVPEELVFSLFTLNGVLNIEGISKPLMGVQITELVDGLFIACSANHSIIDGTSFWHFFNSWSQISRGFDTISKSPVFERWFPNIPLPSLEKNVSQSYITPPLVKRVFEFSKESLAKLKAKANSEAETDKISSLQALSAHLWRSYTRVNNQSNEEAGFMMAIGARGKIPLPEGYFGNAVYSARTWINKAEAEAEAVQKGLGYIALKINELVAQQTKERATKFVQDWVKNPALPVNGGRYSFFITGSPRHDVYENDFGWGKPIGVRSGKGTRFDGNMTTFPTAVAGGIEVHACLTPEVMQAMEDDKDFMEAFTL